MVPPWPSDLAVMNRACCLLSQYSMALKAQALSYTDMTGNGGLIGRFQQAQGAMNRAYRVNIPLGAAPSRTPSLDRLQRPPEAYWFRGAAM